MKLPTLYSRTSKGAVQEWTVEVDDNLPVYRTHHGQLNGKIQTSNWFTCEATNTGRANERNGHEQAIFEATALWKKKKEAGAFEDISEIDTVLFIEPMLAKNWDDRKSLVRFPVFSQPKLDGLRAVITKDGAKSRNGKEWKTIPHILKALEPVFDVYPDLVLDGELYNHSLKEDFNKITSLVKKTKPTAQDIQESSETVQFWWYDIADKSMVFESRSSRLEAIHRDYLISCTSIIPVPTQYVANEKELDECYESYMSDGYEGQMIRLNTPYEFKRSANLLKRKEFIDAEYKILQVGEGNGNRAGTAGYMVLEREDGVQFNSNIKGDMQYLKELLSNKLDIEGKYATVKYFNLTPDGIPRFPYVIKIRDGVSID